jgi:hypothetical protein
LQWKIRAARSVVPGQPAGAAIYVVELVVRAQTHDTAEHAGLARPLAHLHFAFDQGKARPRFAGTLDIGVDVVLEPPVELSLDLVGGAKGADHVAAHHLQKVGKARRAEHRVHL